VHSVSARREKKGAVDSAEGMRGREGVGIKRKKGYNLLSALLLGLRSRPGGREIIKRKTVGPNPSQKERKIVFIRKMIFISKKRSNALIVL